MWADNKKVVLEREEAVVWPGGELRNRFRKRMKRFIVPIGKRTIGDWIGSVDRENLCLQEILWEFYRLIEK